MLGKFISPSGRMSRGGYWLYAVLIPSTISLMLVGLNSASIINDQVYNSAYLGVSLLFFWPLYIAMPIKRFHDLGLSAWVYLASLLVFLAFVMLAVFGIGIDYLTNLEQTSPSNDSTNMPANNEMVIGGVIGMLLAMLTYFVILLVLSGQPYENKYGPDPRD